MTTTIHTERSAGKVGTTKKKILKDKISINLHLISMAMSTRYRNYGPAGLSGKQKKQVKGIINRQKDMKQTWVGISQVPVAATPVISELSLVSKGDNFSQRAEDTIQSLSMKIQWSYGPAATLARQVFRVIIARAKQTPLTVADVPAVTAQPNYERMQVYFDKTYLVDDVALTTILSDSKTLKFKKKNIPYMKISYDEAANATTAFKNGIYFMSTTAEATNGAVIQGACQHKFFNTI